MFLFKFIFHQLLVGSQSRRILSTSTSIKHFKMNHLISRLATRSIVNAMKNQPRLMSSVGVKPLTTLTDDELVMKQTVAKLAQEQILPLVRKMDDDHKFDDGVIKKLFENGLMGVEADPEFGGSGCNFLTMMLVCEELSKVDPSVAALVDIHNTLVINLFSRLGTQAQKEKYLTKLCTEFPGSFALSEPSSGSDAFALKTTAKKDGNHFVLNGTKMWISNSDMAGVFIIMANADPSKGYKGITAFIVERDTEGFTVGKKENKLGICASGTCMLHLDNVRIPEENILGEYGKGYQYSASILNEGRIGIAAQMVGCAQGSFDATIPYLLERKQFGQDLMSFQGMQYQIAEVATDIEAARLMYYNAARMQENGMPFTKEAAMCKYFASEMAQRVTVKCVDWMGGVGFTKDFPQEKFYRDCKIGAIYEGTSNMQLSTIAKLLRKEYSS